MCAFIIDTLISNPQITNFELLHPILSLVYISFKSHMEICKNVLVKRKLFRSNSESRRQQKKKKTERGQLKS